MIWTLVLICLLHYVQSFWPSTAEILARTRWCLGEGAHCPINLYMNFSSCCKPFICTVIPKTHKPTMFLKFKYYKDYRCLYPATESLPVIKSLAKYDDTVNTVESTPYEYEQSTKYNSDVFKNINSTSVNEGSSILNGTPEYATNCSFKTPKETGSGISNKCDEHVVNKTQSDKYKNKLSIEDQPEMYDKKIKVKNIVKRSITNNSTILDKNISHEEPVISLHPDGNNESPEMDSQSSDCSSVSYEENYDITSKSTKNQTSMVDSKSSGDLYSLEYLNKTYNTNITDNLLSYVQENNFNESDSTESKNEYSNTKLINDTIQSDSIYSFVKNTSFFINESSYPTTERTDMNILGDSEEDWHSSQMKYDTRNALHKMVTIPPFRFFQSAEVIRLNESMEISE